MQTLKMKINGYDEQSNSLMVSFCSDETLSQSPDAYQSFAYQPYLMWPDIEDINELKKRIAVAGMYEAQQQAKKESLASDQQKIDAFKALVGQEFVYSVNDLLPPQNVQYTNQVDV